MHIRRTDTAALAALLTIAAGLAAGTVLAAAADATPIRRDRGDGNKREEKLHDVAMGITALSGDDLLRRQDVRLYRFAAQVPGLSSKESIRGVTG